MTQKDTLDYYGQIKIKNHRGNSKKKNTLESCGILGLNGLLYVTELIINKHILSCLQKRRILQDNSYKYNLLLFFNLFKLPIE